MLCVFPGDAKDLRISPLKYKWCVVTFLLEFKHLLVTNYFQLNTS